MYSIGDIVKNTDPEPPHGTVMVNDAQIVIQRHGTHWFIPCAVEGFEWPVTHIDDEFTIIHLFD